MNAVLLTQAALLENPLETNEADLIAYREMVKGDSMLPSASLPGIGGGISSAASSADNAGGTINFARSNTAVFVVGAVVLVLGILYLRRK